MYQYLNHNNQWPRVRRFGLEVDEDGGALTLRKLPGPPKPIGCTPGVPAADLAPAGLAVGSNGTIYISDPGSDRVFRVDPQSGEASPLKCLGSTLGGWEVGQLNTPRGLAFQECRNRLLIADTENSRIQVVDPEQERVVAIWGQTWPYEMPRPRGKFGGLDGPEQLACDRAGNVYVIDRMKPRPATKPKPARVVRLNRDGDFQSLVDCGQVDPVHIACGQSNSRSDNVKRDCVFVLAYDSLNQRFLLFVFDRDGKPLVHQPLRLLGPEPPVAPEAVSVVTYGIIPSSTPRIADGTAPLGAVSAFTVIGTSAVVAFAGKAPRVWCFEISEAIAKDDPNAVEPSWLPLYDGPAVALGVRGNPNRPGVTADLILLAGPGRGLYSFAHRGAFRTQGAFLAGPFTGNRGAVTLWHRLRFDGTLSENAHMQWFTLSRSEAQYGWVPPPRPLAGRLPNWFRLETQPDMFDRLRFALTEEVSPDPGPDEFHPIQRPGASTPTPEPDRTAESEWFAMPENQLDGLVRNVGGTPNQPADQMWVFGLIAGDESTSPTLSQARLEHDEDGWLSDLPEVYQRNPASRAFVLGLLSLLESRFEDVTEVIDRLPALFSPHAMSDRYGRRSAELDWLRAVLALPTTPRLRDLPSDRKRNELMFRDGSYWLARRGTLEGLRRLIWLATGVELVIEEPGVYDLPQVVGGPDLAGAAAPGTDLLYGIGNENILGYSALADPADLRPRLPDDWAHHFVVRGYESDLIDSDMRQLIEQVVARSAPAHLTYSIQVIEPRARLGIQSRLGIDAVVAPRHPADPLTLGVPPGPEAQLDPQPIRPTVGAAHLNRNTPLL
jgi:hypothetical protein